ncbi:MAG: UbiH/UbiF family hydroxylase [Nitrosospira sp.]|nr:UbiH/UbiF family hydroxylase [Nitrosospira sp.]
MRFDIIIIGGGLVGASFALALKESGLKIALIDAHPPILPVENKDWDSRIYAISPGSSAFLESIGVWQALNIERITSVYEMVVFGDDNSARLDFNAYNSGMSELAFIAENRQLQATTWSLLKRPENNVEILNHVECASIKWNESHADLYLTNGNVLETALIVGADGLNSWVRTQAGINISQRSYQQIGVVANFSLALNHRNVAYQWFRRDGVLALLPMPEKLTSMVWSADTEQANILLNLPEAELCSQVASASFHMLGAVQLVTKPTSFPLNFLHVERLVQPRLALIGDAAHGIHPLAGQGMNLGLRDAHELAKTIIKQRPQKDCGDYSLLRRYERARREDILIMELATDGLQKLFNNTHPTIARLRNLGLGITNQLPRIKNYLMQHALH